MLSGWKSGTIANRVRRRHLLSGSEAEQKATARDIEYWEWLGNLCI